MRTNHELAKLKAKSLGTVAVFGNAHEDGIFSKVNTFGRVNPPKALYYKKVNSSALFKPVFFQSAEKSVTTFGNVPSMSSTSNLGMLSNAGSMGTIAVLLGIGYLMTR